MKVEINPEYSFLLNFTKTLPHEFTKKGEVLYKVRNEVRLIEVDGLKLVVKKFKVPHFINRIAYTFFRKSKACRSYEHSKILIENGFKAATPVFYTEYFSNGLITDSYYASVFTGYTRDFNEFRNSNIDGRFQVLKDFAHFAARMHEKGILHLDFGGGNIQFSETENGTEFCLLDVNRMRMGKVGMKAGVENFKLLYMREESFHFLIREYASIRGFDVEASLKLIDKYIHRN